MCVVNCQLLRRQLFSFSQTHAHTHTLTLILPRHNMTPQHCLTLWHQAIKRTSPSSIPGGRKGRNCEIVLRLRLSEKVTSGTLSESSAAASALLTLLKSSLGITGCLLPLPPRAAAQ